MKSLTVWQSQLNSLVSEGVQECIVSKQTLHEICALISNIVTKANQSGTVLLRSCFETGEILAG